MARTKLEQAQDVRAQILQLQNKEKLLLQQHKEAERKARTHRICQRGALLESLLPDTIGLTEEQFSTFLRRTTANEFGRTVLAEITAQGAEKSVELENAVLASNGGTNIAADADNDAEVKG